MPTTDPFPRGSGAPLRTSSVGAPEPDVRRAGRAQSTSMSLMDVAVGAPGACLEREAGRGRLPGQGRWFELLQIRGEFDGASGAPGTIRSDSMSKSATKAFRGEIGREQKPGISAFLFVCPGSIGAFATDLDKRRRRGPPGGAPRAGRRPRRVFGPDRSSLARADPAALTGQGGGSGPAPSGADGPGDPCTEAGRVRTRPRPLLLAPR